MGLFGKKEGKEPETQADFLVIAKAFFKQKDYENAIAACNEGIGKKCNSRFDLVDLRHFRGMSYFHTKNYELAVKDLSYETFTEGSPFRGIGNVHKTNEMAKELLKEEKKKKEKENKVKNEMKEMEKKAKKAIAEAEEKLKAETGGVEE